MIFGTISQGEMIILYRIVISAEPKAWLYFLYSERRFDKNENLHLPRKPKSQRQTVVLEVRDFIIICTGLILSVVVLVNLWNVLPIAATASYAFLSLRADETSIIDYIFNAAKFFLTSQQLYFWREN